MAEQIRNKGAKRFLAFSELAAFCLQVSMILKSGIPLHEGLGLLKEDVPDQKLKSILTEVSEAVADRKSFHEALEKTEAFPEYMVNMVKIGSDAGKLDDVLFALSSYYEREDELRQNIKSAVVYPMALIVMMLIVMMVLSVKVLPVFEQVFRGLGTTMSPAATAIMNFGLLASNYSFVLLGVAAVILVLLVLVFKSDRGEQILSGIATSGKLSEKVSLARFSSSLALMLSSGLDTEHGLKLAQSVVSNIAIKEKINQCIHLIDNNHSFLDAMDKSKLYPSMTLRMLSLGFKAGNMDVVMHKIADTAEAEIEALLIRRVSLIEPVSVAFLCLIIGIILISVMLPLMSIMSSIG